MRAFLLLSLASVLSAAPPLDPSARLERARQILIERDKRLPDYTCVQTVDRRYFERRQTDNQPLSCAQIHALGLNGLLLQSSDRLRLDIKVSHGTEIGSWPGSQFNSRSVFDLIGGGPYGTGVIGGMISDIFVNGGAVYGYLGDDLGATAYSYRVPLEASHYRVKAGSDWVLSPFSGAFWLDANSLELKRLLLQARNLPVETNSCEAATTVEYQKVRVGAGDFLLPRRSSIRLVMRDAGETRLTAVYSGCREYLGESTIHFDEVADAGPAAPVPVSTAPLPPGLELPIALSAPIDTDTAAAGDIVKARLRRALHAPRSKAVLAPAGATVLGRVVEMRHWLEKPRQFTIAIVLETLEAGGVSRPLYAKIDRGHGPSAIELPPVGASLLVAGFYFKTDQGHYRVPAGYESTWVTVEPPAEETR